MNKFELKTGVLGGAERSIRNQRLRLKLAINQILNQFQEREKKRRYRNKHDK